MVDFENNIQKANKLKNLTPLLSSEEIQEMLADKKYGTLRANKRLVKNFGLAVLACITLILIIIGFLYLIIYNPFESSTGQEKSVPLQKQELKKTDVNKHINEIPDKVNISTAPNKQLKTEKALPDEKQLTEFSSVIRENEIICSYKLVSNSKVQIKLYDKNGSYIKTMMKEQMQNAGPYKIHLNLTGIKKGDYVIKILSGRKILHKQNINIK